MPPSAPCAPEGMVTCGGCPCGTRPPEKRNFSRWRDFEGYARGFQESLRSQTSAFGPRGGVHGAVSQTLEELQLHVAAEVRRLQTLLASAPLSAPPSVPHGDAAPMATDYLTRRAELSPWEQTPSPAQQTTSACKAELSPCSRAASPASSLQRAGQQENGGKSSDHDCWPHEQHAPALGQRGKIQSDVDGRAAGSPTKARSGSDGAARTGANLGSAMTGLSSHESEAHARRARASEAQLAERLSLTDFFVPQQRPPTPLELRLKRLVASNQFELFFISAVIVSTILMGVQTQWAALNIGEDEPLVLRAIQHGFAFLFLLELAIRTKAVGAVNLFCGSGRAWAWLDLIVVLGSLVEFALDVAMSAMEGDGGISKNNIKVIRIVRLVRFLRGFRIKRLLHLVAGLRTLVFSIAATLRSLMWALVLLFLIMYMVGIMLTQGVVDYLADGNQHGPAGPDVHRFWRTLDVTMFTLFQSITGGVSWIEPADSLAQVSVLLVWLFTAYLAFTCFAVMNVVTGVFCNSAIESAARNPEVIAHNVIANRQAYVDNLNKLFSQVDEDNNAMMTFGEFEEILSDPQNRAFLAALEIEANDAWMLFKLIDVDQDGVLQKDEFIQGCVQLRGNAKNVEIMNLNRQVISLERKLGRFIGKVDECCQLLTAGATKCTTAGKD